MFIFFKPFIIYYWYHAKKKITLGDEAPLSRAWRYSDLRKPPSDEKTPVSSFVCQNVTCYILSACAMWSLLLIWATTSRGGFAENCEKVWHIRAETRGAGGEFAHGVRRRICWRWLAFVFSMGNPLLRESMKGLFSIFGASFSKFKINHRFWGEPGKAE